jgi:hypothetical protein
VSVLGVRVGQVQVRVVAAFADRGALMARPRSVYPGDRFGRLTVVREAGWSGRNRTFECRCVCGGTTVAQGWDLRAGNTRSCGCLSREASGERLTCRNQRRRKHGHALGSGESPTYKSWESMLQRCRNPKASAWDLYGGRGVTVCDRWLSFENFLADMGERPEGLTLDRIDPNGHYEPGNCRWATWAVQATNRRTESQLRFAA